MKPVTIKYRDGNQQIVSVRADGCSGQIPGNSNIYYCVFYRDKKQVARVAKSRLLPGYFEAYLKLFGRPWLTEIKNAESITLSEYRDWESEVSGYPKDTEQIWMVNHDKHTWVMQRKDRCTLHIMNNAEVTRRGNFHEALKALFPGKKIKAYYPTVSVVEV